jgi:hypothetical protein
MRRSTTAASARLAEGLHRRRACLGEDLDAKATGAQDDAPPGPRTAAAPSLTRRALLVAGGSSLAALALPTSDGRAARTLGGLIGTADAPRPPGYRSRPDLQIPGLTVTTAGRLAAPGSLLIAPYNAPNNAQAGGVIVDGSGQPLWEQPLAGLVTTDLRVQTFHGSPVLTWWQGTIKLGHGVGRYVIADSSYAPIAHVNAGNRHQGDLHEFLITDRDTALLTTYTVTAVDLRAVGGPRNGSIQDAMLQEVDIASGKVLLEWRSLAHIAMTESYWPLGSNWDYVHLNSVAVDSDQNLLVSCRNTHAVYKINRRTGAIIWRLGGKHSDFRFAPGAAFAWQHDARRRSDGTISLFDNGSKVSRALVLAVDETRRRVALQRAYQHPAGLFAVSQGNAQTLPNGNVLVGWGAQPYVSEFTEAGQLVFDARLGAQYISYRAFRMPWMGKGPGVPALATERASAHTNVYVSWNGDTRVARWSVLAGTSAAALAEVATVARTGFETTVGIAPAFTHVQVRALDATGTALAATNPTAI